MINPFSYREFLINPEDLSKHYVSDTLNSKNFNHDQPNIKSLDEPIIKFNLTTRFPRIVYKKYKILYRENYFVKSESGLFSDLFSFFNTNSTATELEILGELYSSDKVPDSGLIIPDSTDHSTGQISTNNMSLLLDFVNTQDTTDILNWVSKYGTLNNYHFEKHKDAQDIRVFVEELKILQSLYHLFTAVNEYAQYNTEPLKKRAKFVKITDYMKELELNLNEKSLIDLPNVRFWGYDVSSCFNIKADKNFIDKHKNKSGYLLFIDNAPTMSYFESPTITDNMLPTKVMEVISTIINYKTNYRNDGQAVNRYSLTAEIQPNTNNAPALYRLIPSIQCSDSLVLMYFQFLWLISTDGTKPCKKCGQYFLPEGERPGSQKYCGHCGNHPAQDQYKKRTLMAIKAYKSGSTLEQASSDNKISIQRLAKALKDGV